MINTSTNRAFIESEVYSQFVLLNLHDGLLGGSFYRNVSDFPAGETLHIKTVGDVTLQECAEEVPLVYSPIESGEIQFRITEYKGDAWYITDEMREDGAQIDTLLAQRAAASTRAIQETFESDFLRTAADAQASNSRNLVNGFPHRIKASGANGTLDLEDLVDARLALDKANVPAEGRVFIVDPVVEATLNKKVTITSDITPFAVSLIENGMARGQRFIMNLYGFDIMTSNRLHRAIGAEANVKTFSNDGTGVAAGDIANIIMCIADDQAKPIMGAWRRMPKSEAKRNPDLRRDEHLVTCRYGMGAQRLDTLMVIFTSPTATK